MPKNTYFDRAVTGRWNASSVWSRPSAPTGGGIGAGDILSVGGALLGATGSYYAAKSRKYQLDAAKQDAEFEASMSAINARNAAIDAQSILHEGALDIAVVGMQYAQEKAGFAVQTAAAGVDAGTGSAAEVAASIELSKRIQMMSMNVSRVREASGARLRGVDFGSRGILSRASAANLRSSSRGVDPFAEAGGNFLGLAGNAMNNFVRTRR